jgi:hypothetical protein
MLNLQFENQDQRAIGRDGIELRRFSDHTIVRGTERVTAQRLPLIRLHERRKLQEPDR